MSWEYKGEITSFRSVIFKLKVCFGLIKKVSFRVVTIWVIKQVNCQGGGILESFKR